MNIPCSRATGHTSAAREQSPNTFQDVCLKRDKRPQMTLDTIRRTAVQTSYQAQPQPVHPRIFNPPLRAPAPAGQP